MDLRLVGLERAEPDRVRSIVPAPHGSDSPNAGLCAADSYHARDKVHRRSSPPTAVSTYSAYSVPGTPKIPPPFRSSSHFRCHIVSVLPAREMLRLAHRCQPHSNRTTHAPQSARAAAPPNTDISSPIQKTVQENSTASFQNSYSE